MKEYALLLPLLFIVTPVASQHLDFPEVDRCSFPAVTGRCKAYIPSYFFNSETQKCERFVYGGCGGNANRFSSKQECQRSCSCTLPPDPGQCFAAFPQWFYDSRYRTCRQFTYGGCGGNDNNFEGYGECMRVCSRDSTRQQTQLK